jgi:hypothetical protein
MVGMLMRYYQEVNHAGGMCNKVFHHWFKLCFATIDAAAVNHHIETFGVPFFKLQNKKIAGSGTIHPYIDL